MLADVFPAAVATAELQDPVNATLLFAAEAAQCSAYSRKRIDDFTAGRLCARRALADLGIVNYPLLGGADRLPIWPPGIVGSISHTSGYCCAAVAFAATFRSIGLDAEIVGRVTDDLDRLIFTSAESAYLAGLSPAERSLAKTVVFSAKEAFFKCQFPVTGRQLEFIDASVTVVTDDLRAGALSIDSTSARAGPDLIEPLRGRFASASDVVVTGVTLSAHPRQAPHFHEPDRDLERR